MERPERRGTPPWVLLLVAVPALAFTTWGAVLGVFSGKGQASRRAAEPLLNARELCRRVAQHHALKGEWVSAGPVPAAVPARGETLPFTPDEGFRALGFKLPMTHHQYAVEVTREGGQVKRVRCLARDDADADGVPTTVVTEVDPESHALGPVGVEPASK
jgi:hypothetical protein